MQRWQPRNIRRMFWRCFTAKYRKLPTREKISSWISNALETYHQAMINFSKALETYNFRWPLKHQLIRKHKKAKETYDLVLLELKSTVLEKCASWVIQHCYDFNTEHKLFFISQVKFTYFFSDGVGKNSLTLIFFPTRGKIATGCGVTSCCWNIGDV